MNSSFKKLILMNTLYGLLWGVIFIWAKYMDVISEAPKGGIFRFDFQSLVGCILLSGIYLFPLFKMAVKNTNLPAARKYLQEVVGLHGGSVITTGDYSVYRNSCYRISVRFSLADYQ